MNEGGRISLDDPNRVATTPSTKAPTVSTVPVNGTSPVGTAGVPGDALALSRNELAVANRGPDEVVRVFATNACVLTIHDRFSSGAKRPRGLALQGNSLLVGHELGPLSRFEMGKPAELLLPKEKGLERCVNQLSPRVLTRNRSSGPFHIRHCDETVNCTGSGDSGR